MNGLRVRRIDWSAGEIADEEEEESKYGKIESKDAERRDEESSEKERAGREKGSSGSYGARPGCRCGGGGG